MKILSVLIPFLALAAAAVRAEFRLPPGIYRMEKLEVAVARANQLKKPLAFLLSDESSACPITDQVSLDAIKKLRLRTVVIYAHSKRDWNILPQTVKTAFNSPEAGKYIPMVAVVDPDLVQILAIIPCVKEERERAKLFREKLRSF